MPTDSEALIAAIRGPSPAYKRAEVAALVAHPKEVVPGLLALLAEVAKSPARWIERHDDDLGPLYAVAVLAHLREASAHGPLIGLTHIEADDFETLFGTYLTEGFDVVLVATCDRKADGIRALVSDRKADGYLRAQAADALVHLVLLGFADRSATLGQLVGLLTEDESEEQYFYTGVVGAMMKLHPEEHAEALQNACESGLVFDGMISWEEVQASFTAGDDEVEPLPTDVHDWISWWSCFED